MHVINAEAIKKFVSLKLTYLFDYATHIKNLECTIFK